MKINIKGVIVSNDDKWAYDLFEIEAVCPAEVLERIDKANGAPLDVYINSGGGDLFAGVEIYSALRDYAGSVNIHVVGLAASAASLIMCAGDCDITPAGMVMLHNVQGYADGDYRDMRKGGEVLVKASEAIAAAYEAKTGLPQSELLAMLDNETWLTAAEAVAAGFADRVTETRLAASYSVPLLSRSTIDKAGALYGKGKSAAAPEAQARFDLLKLGGKVH